MNNALPSTQSTRKVPGISCRVLILSRLTVKACDIPVPKYLNFPIKTLEWSS